MRVDFEVIQKFNNGTPDYVYETSSESDTPFHDVASRHNIQEIEKDDPVTSITIRRVE